MPHSLPEWMSSPAVSSTTPAATTATAATVGNPAESPVTTQPRNRAAAARRALRTLPGSVSEPALARTWKSTASTVFSISSTLINVDGAPIGPTIHSGTTTSTAVTYRLNTAFSAVTARKGTVCGG